MELIDSHCHLDVAEFDHDREQVVEHCKQLGIGQIIVPGIDAPRWNKLLELCQQYTAMRPALGLHPIFIDKHQPDDIQSLEKAIDTHRPLAVGEIGLDFFIKALDKDKQQNLFEAQLNIARNTHLPVILHARKSHDQILQTLKRIPVKGGIAHAFNGSLQQAQQFIELGFKLGFGGTMTYERSNKIRALAKALPLSAMVLETDAPDMVVSTHRGERNSPEYLPDCLTAIADIRETTPEMIAEQTTRNVRDVLNIN
jgi:TatD DNase family protein